jgi:hypothetical protein
MIGKFGQVRLPTSGASDHTYSADVLRSSSPLQCLDFYYYITDASENAKMELTWKAGEDLDSIVEVQAVTNENKWQHRRVTFQVSPSITAYKVREREIIC